MGQEVCPTLPYMTHSGNGNNRPFDLESNVVSTRPHTPMNTGLMTGIWFTNLEAGVLNQDHDSIMKTLLYNEEVCKFHHIMVVCT